MPQPPANSASCAVFASSVRVTLSYPSAEKVNTYAPRSVGVNAVPVTAAAAPPSLLYATVTVSPPDAE